MVRVRENKENVLTVGEACVRFASESQSSPWGSYETAEGWQPPFFSNREPPPLTTSLRVGDVMTDVEIPNFRKRLAAGETLPINPMSKTSLHNDGFSTFHVLRSGPVEWNNSPSLPQWRRTWRYDAYYVRHTPRHITPTVPWDAMLMEARAKLAAGFMDVLTTVSEFHKTVELVVNFKHRVREAILRLLRDWRKDRRQKKLSFRSVKHALEDLSSFWLEYRFGWRILWYDYLSIRKVIESITGDIVKKSHRVTFPLPTREYETVLWPTGGLASCTRTDIHAGTARAGVFGSLDARQNLQLDPITTAWELLPLSLVIDMFWNVGDVLAAISPFSNVQEESLWTSLDLHAFSIYKFEAREVAPWTIVRQEQFDYGLSESRTYNRQPVQPGSMLPIPSINLSILKALDLGAIAVVLANGVLPRVLNRRA